MENSRRMFLLLKEDIHIYSIIHPGSLLKESRIGEKISEAGAIYCARFFAAKFAKNDICATIKAMMKNTFISKNSKQTQKLGEMMAEELQGGEIVCLSGELGSGKTTFAQGVLKGLGAKGPYTSPTFVVLKHYRLKTKSEKRKTGAQNLEPENVYHIDAYRVGANDILDLGWEEIIGDKSNVMVVEWAENIRTIVPRRAVWLKFEHMENDKRKIVVK